MTMLGNQRPKGFANVLLDEGIPNTISGVGLTTTSTEPSPLRGLAVVAVLAVLVVLLVVLVLVVAGAA